MKKILYFASLMLAVFTTTSCSDMKDNPVVPPTPEKTTTTITLDGVDYEADVVATFTGEIGKEVNLILGVYDRFDIYGVDFGDGKILTDTVCSENLGLKGEDGLEQPGTNHKSATTFTGTVAGEGMITVYSVAKSDIWYLKVEGNAMPTSLDQEKLLNVVQASFSGANVESVELPAMEKLTLFSFTNSPIKSLDISKATALTRIDIYNTTQSAFEPQLKEIDLSKNTELETVVLGGSTYKKGELTSLDFTNNTKLTQISAENNKLTAVTGIPVSVKNIYLTGNKLKELDLSGITNKGNIQIANNLFTLATLPTKPAVTTTSKYTYAPQPAYEVAEAITDQNNLLDLSSQLTATGVAAEPQTTTYTFLAGTTELKENEDYKVVEPGKFTFLKSQTEKVHAVMATDAFPKFTGKNAYVTTEFTVNVQGGSSESSDALFSWEAGKATGGTATGNGADAENVKEDVIVISSKKANIASDNITITLDNELKAGDVITVTGYKNKNAEGKIVSLYFWFNDDTNMFNDSETWVNIYKDETNPDYDNDGETPNTNTYTVPEGAAGTKVIKLARSKANTNLFVTKFTITRK
jgi:hypothetical protein